MEELILKNERGNLVTNVQELKNQLPAMLKKYDYIVTDDTAALAKADRAALNKTAKKLDARRIEYEKETYADWLKTKEELMDVSKEIKATAKRLGNELDVLDKDRQETMKTWCEDTWDEISWYYSFDDGIKACMQIYGHQQPMWMYKTLTKDKIKSEMKHVVDVWETRWNETAGRWEREGMDSTSLELLFDRYSKHPDDVDGIEDYAEMLNDYQNLTAEEKEETPIEFGEDGEIREWHKVSILCTDDEWKEINKKWKVKRVW